MGFFLINSSSLIKEDLQLQNQIIMLHISILKNLVRELSKNEIEQHDSYLRAMRAILLALDTYFDKKIPQVDLSTGALMTLSKMQADRERLLLDAVMLYDNQSTNFYVHGEYITDEEIFNFDDEEYVYDYKYTYNYKYHNN